MPELLKFLCLNIFVVIMSIGIMFSIKMTFPLLYNKHDKVIDVFTEVIAVVYIPLSPVLIGIYIPKLYSKEHFVLPVVVTLIFLLIVKQLKHLLKLNVSAAVRTSGCIILFSFQAAIFLVYCVFGQAITNAYLSGLK